MGVQPGDGVVGRYGDIAVVAGVGGEADAFTRELLDLLAAGSAERSVAWRVAELLAHGHQRAPAFGIVLGADEGIRVLLFGRARAVVDGVEVSGTDALTWVDRLLPEAHTVALTVARTSVVTADPLTDLGHGVLPGAGFVLETLAPSADEQPPATSLEAPPPPSREHIATVARAPAKETMTVAGLFASLVADDGSRVPLDRPYVLGRDPRRDPEVQSGAASPVFIPDQGRTVSRVQARVELVDRVLRVTDAGSINGTYIAAPGDEEWTRLGPDPFPLREGWSLRVGQRVYTFIGPPSD